MMKKLFYGVLGFVMLIGCHKGGDDPEEIKMFTETVSDVSFDMIYVEGGTFQMGATEEQGEDVYDDEMPVHTVILSDYYIGKHEVTQGLWQVVMGDNPSSLKGDDYPVEHVSWNDIQEFIAKLNELTGKKYALPTEAQWEYAARGGAKSKGYRYSGGDEIDEVAWYADNSEKTIHPVGTKKANELGVYDMSGNVYEWCWDRFASNYYETSSETDPTGPEIGPRRVYRGGDCSRYANLCRVSIRNSNAPARRDYNVGFRLVLQP